MPRARPRPTTARSSAASAASRQRRLHDQRQLPDGRRHLQRLRHLLHVERQLPGDRHRHLQRLRCGLHGATNCPTVSGICNANSANAGTACTANAQLHDQAALLQQPADQDLHGEQPVHAAPGTCSATSGNAGAACTANSQLHDQARHLRRQCGQRRRELHQRRRTARKKTGVCSLTGTTCSSQHRLQGRPAAHFRRSAAPAASTASPATTLLDDANGSGLTCRRNNKDYAGVTAARNNYPDATYNVPVTGGTRRRRPACATPRYKLVPRHYWKTSVEWCDKAIATGRRQVDRLRHGDRRQLPVVQGRDARLPALLPVRRRSGHRQRDRRRRSSASTSTSPSARRRRSRTPGRTRRATPRRSRARSTARHPTSRR